MAIVTRWRFDRGYLRIAIYFLCDLRRRLLAGWRVGALMRGVGFVKATSKGE
jgi:hypothetical protein